MAAEDYPPDELAARRLGASGRAMAAMVEAQDRWAREWDEMIAAAQEEIIASVAEAIRNAEKPKG